MAITFRSARVWVPGVVSCLVLLGQATGALANEASAASRTASDAAPAGRPFIPAPGQVSVLQGVSCPSVTSCWAVGTYWNGRTWSLASSPDPDGTGAGASNFLSDVVCTSAANCWAVGSYGSTSSGGEMLNEALHWDGRTWSQASTPNPAGTVSGAINALRGVRCASPASCWAVGRDAPAGQSEGNQALHWNGSSWSAG